MIVNTYKRLPKLALVIILAFGLSGSLYSGSTNDLAQDDVNTISVQEVDNQDQPDPKRKKPDLSRKTKPTPKSITPRVQKSPEKIKTEPKRNITPVKNNPPIARTKKKPSPQVKEAPQRVRQESKNSSPRVKEAPQRIRQESKNYSPQVKETRQKVKPEPGENRTRISPGTSTKSINTSPRVQRTFTGSRSNYTNTMAFARKSQDRKRVTPYREHPRLQNLPDGYTSFIHDGYNYFHCRGIFYRHRAGGYYVVPAPIGYIVTVLPYGCYDFWYHDMWYYHYYGAYYRYDIVREVYIVIENPVSEEDSNQPGLPGSSIFDVVQIFDGSTVEGYFVGGTPDTVFFKAVGDTLRIPVANIISITFAPPSFADATE
jgi:outer membrane biosynthesis protein TonB